MKPEASLPGPTGEDHPLKGIATYLFEMGHLKYLNRAGWLLLGITQPEAVAEHSFRVGVVGITLAAMEGADPGRAAALCLLHDAHETSATSRRSAAPTSARPRRSRSPPIRRWQCPIR
jgi:putative hydrolases of HD superfamily